ncbi:cysteine desulfurase/selenocysteine lyase [Luteibacter sp. Sphag1AF]|uniref:aminotransferase class V-fold PLP-dependent enzyme n=1 Tax=Luteibacter sp. Sphag1AF TaxID=2587031 RepID=UPI001618158C|nr:cysteine desulfurase [Luteibacter sp. Sphag1AF]MBB3225693.1 cysteine desulfurase/selenocysteine lyase [Luteibacter sp. Sphag1AF]
MNAKVESRDLPLDVERIRADFPLLARTVHGKPLIYFDNANTGQKPLSVIEAVDSHYRQHNANVARAVHQLGEEATAAYEGARDSLARFINAPSRNEVILTSGTTQSINLVAYSWALPRLKPGDAILTTVMEHHANIVPWQLVAERTGAVVRGAPIDANGELIVEAFIDMLTPDVKLACVTHVSNVLGTVNPIRELARECRKRGIPLLVDGSQAAPHRPIDVQALGCDFYAVTGHKMLAPTGTGALWARREHLESMPPFFGGGEMIREVRFDGTVFADPPHRFEAGTPNIAGFVGMTAAIDYLNGLGFDRLKAYEQDLLAYATTALESVAGIRIFGRAAEKEPVISFLIEGAHANDMATLLDLEGVAVRSGHHCAHPLMQFFGVPATLRASLAFYNTRAEVDAFIQAIQKVRKLLL